MKAPNPMLGSGVDYQIRVSARARCVRLCVTVEKGLEVVVPRRYDTAQVPQILERAKRWIQRAIARVESRRRDLEAAPPWQLPVTVALPAEGAEWQIEARNTGARQVSVRELPDRRLMVSGPIENEALCREALTTWLMRRTRGSLVPRLQHISGRIGLPYQRVSVRRQTTRWGSCSARGTISLNAKLLLLPPEVVDYVLIHELCHLREMNHSKRFWELVRRHQPDFRLHDRRLRQFWRSIPRWAS